MRAVWVTTGKHFDKATKRALGLWRAQPGPPQEHQEPASDVREDPEAAKAHPTHCNDHFVKTELSKFLQNRWTNFDHFCQAESSSVL